MCFIGNPIGGTVKNYMCVKKEKPQKSATPPQSPLFVIVDLLQLSHTNILPHLVCPVNTFTQKVEIFYKKKYMKLYRKRVRNV